MTIPETGVVILYFTAAWCGPCRTMGPIINSIESELEGKITVQKVDIDRDENQELTTEYGVQAVPTFLFLKDQKEVARVIGAVTRENLMGKAEEALA